MLFIIEFIITLLIILACGFVAGLIGGLLGLGGAVILTPLLTSVFENLPIQYAAGISLVSALMTSLMSGYRYLNIRLPNVKVMLFLCPITTFGAIMGSLMAYHLISRGFNWILYLVFSFIMILTMVLSLKRKEKYNITPILTRREDIDHIILNDVFFDTTLKTYVNYTIYRMNLIKSIPIMFFGGLMSGLLGIGGGPINILALYNVIGLPLKVATATSNLIVGVTAATSGSLYWAFGYIQPYLAMASAVGIAPGAYLASYLLPRVRSSSVKVVLLSVFSYLSVRMLLSGLNRGHILIIPIMTRHIIAFSVLLLALMILLIMRKYITD
ncbi:Putative permease [Vulcanisaeta moutnovskia 768-28]|uniref:Probable membrane transporter protein n=1 Tax=Vulcanisaeta moutnovskia (strain 768-28) TaxID=985053 RepID=F0QUN1_VULM7|nr:sulfite exporter TauE/SafE family protein [Vulcanisaeta moutnovskia]ADY00692.1 Putative permease [Vulcanisaeta moutnovskia 768-28]